MESFTGDLNFGWSLLSGWLDADGKHPHSSRPEFYELDTDPHEERNLLAGGAVGTSSYVAALDALSRKRRLEVGAGVELDEAETAELSALGYAAVGDVGDEGLPDPLAEQRRNVPAAKILRLVLEQNPNNLYVLITLGGVLLDHKLYSEAVEVLERLLALDPERFLTHIYLAVANEALGNLEVTAGHYEPAYRIRPSQKGLRKEIQRVERPISGR